MAVVIVGWVLFRSGSLREALAMLAGMIGLHGFALSDAFRWQLGGLELAVLALALLAVYAGPWLARRAASRASWEPALAGRLAVIPLFLLALLRSTAESFTPFLYFRF
jgi:alginate O-acetyltransferase complex protein AlgI